jgi:hypothetical protein
MSEVQVRYDKPVKKEAEKAIRIRIIHLSADLSKNMDDVKDALRRYNLHSIDTSYRSNTEDGAVCRIILDPRFSLEDEDVKKFVAFVEKTL